MKSPVTIIATALGAVWAFLAIASRETSRAGGRNAYTEIGHALAIRPD